MADYFHDVLPRQKEELKRRLSLLNDMLNEISLLPDGETRENMIKDYDNKFEEVLELKREIELNSYIGNPLCKMGL